MDFDILAGGTGTGIGATLGALIAKYFVSKHDKEIYEMKKELKFINQELSNNERTNSKRDINIAVLQTNQDSFRLTLEQIDKKIDKIFDKLDKK